MGGKGEGGVGDGWMGRGRGWADVERDEIAFSPAKNPVHWHDRRKRVREV